MSTSESDSGNNGGFDSTDLKSLLVFGAAYGVATTIAVKTIDRFTAGRRKENGNKGTNSKDQTGGNGTSNLSTCNIIFPNAVFVTPPSDSSNVGSTLQTSGCICSNKNNPQNQATAAAAGVGGGASTNSSCRNKNNPQNEATATVAGGGGGGGDSTNSSCNNKNNPQNKATATVAGGGGGGGASTNKSNPQNEATDGGSGGGHSSCSNKSDPQNEATATAASTRRSMADKINKWRADVKETTKEIAKCAKAIPKEIAKSAQSDQNAAGLKKPSIPTYCGYILDFYKDCINDEHNRCGGYREVIKRCHEAGVASGDSSTISHRPLDPELIFMSYQGCREAHQYEPDQLGYCKHYSAYMKKANAVLE